MDWQEITLGQLYSNASQGLGTIASRSPVKVHLEVDERFTRAVWMLIGPLVGIAWWGLQQLPRLLPQPQRPLLPTTKRPHWQRTQALDAAIATAWAAGHYRYDDLIEMVRHRTGRGCSRRAIARFKRSQGLIG